MGVPFDARVVWGALIPKDAPVAGPNERCIEIPLGLEALHLERPGRVLDAGCAVNGFIPEDGVGADVWHLTQHLASETLVIPKWSNLTRSYCAADLRRLEMFATRAFQRTVCISTLEHVGLDNRTYGGPEEACPGSMLKAFKELCRITTEQVFVTVPFAETGVGCAQWRFFAFDSLGALIRMAKDFGFTMELAFYAKTEGGWYGGESTPVEASLDGFPHAVNAIVCLRCTQ